MGFDRRRAGGDCHGMFTKLLGDLAGGLGLTTASNRHCHLTVTLKRLARPQEGRVVHFLSRKQLPFGSVCARWWTKEVLSRRNRRTTQAGGLGGKPSGPQSSSARFRMGEKGRCGKARDQVPWPGANAALVRGRGDAYGVLLHFQKKDMGAGPSFRFAVRRLAPNTATKGSKHNRILGHRNARPLPFHALLTYYLRD